MPSNPDECECGSRLFTAVWEVRRQADADAKLDPKRGNTTKRRVGFECIECGAVQLTRRIPLPHARDSSLAYPDAADRDMVNE